MQRAFVFFFTHYLIEREHIFTHMEWKYKIADINSLTGITNM